MSFNLYSMENYEQTKQYLEEFGQELLVEDQRGWGTVKEAVDAAQELGFTDKKIEHLLDVCREFTLKKDGNKTIAIPQNSENDSSYVGNISVYWKFFPALAIDIDRLHIEEKHRNQGIATALMLTILVGIKKQIEKNGIPRDNLKFELSAEAYGENGLNQEQLIAFYKSFGFDNDSRDTTFSSEVPLKLIIPLKSKEEALKAISCWKCAEEFVEYNFSNQNDDNGSLDFETAQSMVEQKKKDGFTCQYHK